MRIRALMKCQPGLLAVYLIRTLEYGGNGRIFSSSKWSRSLPESQLLKPPTGGVGGILGLDIRMRRKSTNVVVLRQLTLFVATACLNNNNNKWGAQTPEDICMSLEMSIWKKKSKKVYVPNVNNYFIFKHSFHRCL